MSTFARLFENDVGIDLGTANARVWARGTGLVMDEPSSVAVDARSRKPLAFGDEAGGEFVRWANDLAEEEEIQRAIALADKQGAK